jgi:Zn-dependent peptidase ImmA (M78 family)
MPDAASAVAYNPRTELDRLGIPVVEQWLRDTWGAWSARDRIVVLAAGLSPVERRCVLAHELEHVLAGDAACGLGPVAIEAEHRAEVRAARKLIALSDFCRMRQTAASRAELAQDLGVTQRMLRTRCRDLEGEWPDTSKIAG